MQKFKVSIIFFQGFKCAGPSTRLIWCGTFLKCRISNRERIQWGKNNLIKTSNTPKNSFIEEMGKSLEIAALPNFFNFRFLVPRLVQHKIVAKQILQMSCVSIKLILGNTWDLRTLWHNKILRTIKDQFFRHFYLLIWNCNNIDLELKMNPLHPNITKGHFHTVLHTFFKVPTRRICVTINSFCCW